MGITSPTNRWDNNRNAADIFVADCTNRDSVPIALDRCVHYFD